MSEKYTPELELTALITNRDFLEAYHAHIKPEWKRHYFAYDRLKAHYKALKEDVAIPNGVEDFEVAFLAEIRRVDAFLESTLTDLQEDLAEAEQLRTAYTSNPTKTEQKLLERKLDVSLRAIFDQTKSCDQFFHLNHFVICKIAKKFEKLVESQHALHLPTPGDDLVQAFAVEDLTKDEKRDFVPWTSYRSNLYFTRVFSPRKDLIAQVHDQCIHLYTEVFRRHYPALSLGELEYKKDKERLKEHTRVVLGCKVGAIVTLVSTWCDVGGGSLSLLLYLEAFVIRSLFIFSLFFVYFYIYYLCIISVYSLFAFY